MQRPARAPIPSPRLARPSAVRRPAPATRHAATRALALLSTLAALGTSPAALAQAPAQDRHPGCSVQWQVTVHLDTQPRSLSVRMGFDGGTRGRTSLRLPAGWAGVQEDGTAQLAPVAGDAQLRQVSHAPGQQVQLQWRLTPPDGGPMLAPQWFAFSGQQALPWPDELAGQAGVPVCLSLRHAHPGGTLLSSLAPSPNAGQPDALVHALVSSRATLHQALFAGGALATRRWQDAGASTTLAMPADSPHSPRLADWAQRSEATLKGLRAEWAKAGGDEAPLLLLVLPGGQGLAGSALHRALVLQAPAELALPGTELERVLATQWQRQHLAERLGPLAQLGRGDAVLRAWFTDGLGDFLAERWLLRHGVWTPETYAEQLNLKIARYLASPEIEADNLRVASGRAGPEALMELPAARGEWLAQTWHQALRRAGQPGLEALLRRLQLPPAQSQREGPTSAPLAPQRLLAAMRQVLGDAPLKDLTQHIDNGARFSFGPQTLGPCFTTPGAGAAAPRYQVREQALQRADCQAWLHDGAAQRGEAIELPSSAAHGAAMPAAQAPETAPDEGPRTERRTVCHTVPATARGTGKGSGKAASAQQAAKAGKAGSKGKVGQGHKGTHQAKAEGAGRQVCKVVTVRTTRPHAAAIAGAQAVRGAKAAAASQAGRAGKKAPAAAKGANRGKAQKSGTGAKPARSASAAKPRQSPAKSQSATHRPSPSSRTREARPRP